MNDAFITIYNKYIMVNDFIRRFYYSWYDYDFLMYLSSEPIEEFIKDHIGGTLTEVDNTNKTLECSICYESIEKLLKTTCNHIFCGRCINSWLEKHNTCPYCREEIYKENPVYTQPRQSNFVVQIYDADDEGDDIEVLDDDTIDFTI